MAGRSSSMISALRDKCLPDQRGGTNFMPPSYDPVRHLFFIIARETCVTFAPIKPATITPGGSDHGWPRPARREWPSTI